jgi:type I restriction enzyme S subunit
MSEWALAPLSDVTVNFDSRRVPVKASERQPGPIPYYGATGVVDHVDGFLFDGEYLLVAEDGENLNSRSQPIAFLATGKFWVNNHAHIVQGNARALTRYLQYAVENTDIQGYVTGSAQPKLTKSNLNAIQIPLPSLDDQHAIVEMIGTLDDKIELNREMNRSLETTAQAIFKSWFDGVRESIDLVPAQELIDAGVLVVNDGYRAKNNELAQVGIPFARAGNINDGFDFDDADLLGEEAVRRAGEKVSRPMDVLFTSKGTVGRFAMVGESTPRFAYSPQLCFWRAADPARLDPHVLYCWIQSDDFVDQMESVKGQTDMADYVSLRDQRRMLVPNFPATHHGCIGSRIAPLRARIDSNTVESRVLTQLRDTILPKLLSGEIRIRQAEKAVERVL